MESMTQYTPKQRQVESWIHDIGFRTDLEVPYGEYTVDIYVPELNWAVEVDGPRHIFKKQDRKRDEKLLKYGLEHVFRVPVAITEESFKDIFKTEVIRLKGECPFDKDGN